MILIIHYSALGIFDTSAGNFIAYEDTTVVPSLVQAASGVILELGPGPGNQIHRYDTALVKHVHGIEPNPHFKDAIDAKLDKYNLRDRYKVIVCGIEDSDVLREEGITEGSLDAVLCIQVLCAVKDPKNVMKEVWKLLKPGGKFIFWEHGWSRNRLTTVAQACWNPAWSIFVGLIPSPKISTEEPIFGVILSKPWAAEELKEYPKSALGGRYAVEIFYLPGSSPQRQ
ncbi:hypothetical protein CBS147339_6312 [Penicillium roqueforti]|nr:hypothetical protein CBS147339_6312 [Penicillium roqueforti]KAI3093899.1 hypothetical protein CBS147338_6981 [Penicillium roqueforti]KAI3184900.1 hypothetical protein DTO032C6_5765 [Penicillium roqueforti]